MQTKKLRLGCRVLGFLVLLSFIPLVQAQSQPPIIKEDCLAYAYSSIDRHSFLLNNDSIAYGDRIFIKSNCGFDVYIDDELYGSFNTTEKELFIQTDNLNLTIKSGNYSYIANNVIFFKTQFTWSDQYLTYQENLPEMSFIELGVLTFQENVVSVVSIVIVWFLSVNIYWALINHYLDRNLFEEVVE